MVLKPKKPTINIDGTNLTLAKAKLIASGANIKISESVKGQIKASHKLVESVGKEPEPTYGVNTGFGYFANQKISKNRLQKLQMNLLKSHACGYGDPLSIAETRLAMVLRLNVLVKGFTGVRVELCEALVNLIKANIYPIIPEYGSVGASGDLAPLAHLALPLTGYGMVNYKGKVIPASTALKKAKLEPIKLDVKEGLGLINGTQVMLAVGGLALFEACQMLNIADRVAALTYEAMVGSIDALHPRIHRVRQQEGQMQSAEMIREELQGSYLFNEETEHLRVQDPYSLRCAPVVHGTSRDAINYAYGIVERELNAATDNPLVFVQEKRIVSGGNFHGQPLAFAFDVASMAISEITNISERRLELLLNPNMSHLPAFLTPQEGANSGYMAAQYMSGSIVNENKLLANPACTDSIPGNVGIEDHVSMGMTSARKFRKIVQNSWAVLAAEAVAAAQAIDLRKVHPLGKGTRKTYKSIRSKVPQLKNDRIIADDITKAVDVLKCL